MENNFNRQFSDYKKAIIEAFVDLKNKSRLPSELEHPSPAKLRDYCLWVLANRGGKEYDREFRKFFDPENKYNGDHENSIRKVEVERLKPLINFLNGKTQKTDEDNIKLLAWLINCKPYEVWKEEIDTSVKKEEEGDEETDKTEIISIVKPEKAPVTLLGGGIRKIDGIDHEEEQDDGTTPPKSPSITPHNPSWLAQTLKKPAFYIIIIALCVGGYLLVEAFTPRCMYWIGDRYQLILCRNAGTIGVDTLVIPRNPDTEKLRRIMRPDTLTKNAVGRTWYAKITADSIEFFNQTGFHPVYTEKKLRPVTEYILSKYVWEK